MPVHRSRRVAFATIALLLVTVSPASARPSSLSAPSRAPAAAAADAVADAAAAATSVIDTSDRAAVTRAFRERFVTSRSVRPGWTGAVSGCRVGVTSAGFKAAALTQINYFRGLAGLGGVKLDGTLNAQSQAAALMMDAANALSHSPGPSWPCSTAAGRAGASKSNLCLGCSVAGDIAGYIEDPGTGNEAVGHRRWLLYPAQTTMGVGATPQANAVHVLDTDSWITPGGEPAWVSWPPKGFVPRQHIFPRFSLSRRGADFSDATAQVLFDGTAVAATIITRNGPYGDPVVVIAVNLDRFRAADRTKDHVFRVTVRNIRIGTQVIERAWRTTVFDPR